MSTPQYRNPNEKVSLLEFNVQSFSHIKFHGIYEDGTIIQVSDSFTSIPFDEVMLHEGLVGLYFL